MEKEAPSTQLVNWSSENSVMEVEKRRVAKEPRTAASNAERKRMSARKASASQHQQLRITPLHVEAAGYLEGTHELWYKTDLSGLSQQDEDGTPSFIFRSDSGRVELEREDGVAYLRFTDQQGVNRQLAAEWSKLEEAAAASRSCSFEDDMVHGDIEVLVVKDSACSYAMTARINELLPADVLLTPACQSPTQHPHPRHARAFKSASSWSSTWV
jgi:hypothetical protein